MFLLFAAILGVIFGIGWAVVTGDTTIPWLAVAGFALAAGVISDLAEKAVQRRRAHRGKTRRVHARKAS